MPKRVDWVKKPKVVRLYGNESFFKRREMDRAVEVLPDHHIEKFVGGENDEELRKSLLSANSPFIQMSKLIIVEDANKVNDRDLLKKYCNNPMSDRVVVLVSTNRGRDAKWFKELKVSEQVKCEKISDWKIGAWLVSEAEARGYYLKKGHAEAIVVNAGTNLYALSNELDKLAIYCGERNKIDVEDIQEVLFEHSALSPFEVIRHWGSGNRNAALQFLIRHFEKTPKTKWVRSELVLIKGFLDRTENLLTARSMKDSGSGDGEIASELGRSTWIYKNRIADQVKSRSVAELLNVYSELCKVESEIKRGGSGYLLLQQFIIHN